MAANKRLPSVALCVIFRNDAKTIGKLAESVLNAKRQTDGKLEAAFTEYVFVNTGSTDGSDRIVLDALGFFDMVWPKTSRILEVPVITRDGLNPIVRLANFGWVDDFSKARQFSFDLAQADWKMYLDADDVVPQAASIRPTLQRTIENHPECNVVSMVYDYAPGMTQDVRRLVRAADGWHWIDPLHESLALPEGKHMAIDVWQALAVCHGPAEGASTRSLERNSRIAAKAMEAARDRGDFEKQRFWAFYLGNYAETQGNRADAFRHLTLAAQGYGNIATLAGVALSKIYMAEGMQLQASQAAASAIAACPEMREGYAQLAMTYADRPYEAAVMFDRFLAMPQQTMHAGEETAFTNGDARIAAAKTYLQIGEIEKAKAALAGVPATIREHFQQIAEEITFLESKLECAEFEQQIAKLNAWTEARMVPGKTELARLVGLHRLKAFYDYLLWSTEPKKAQTLLQLCTPTPISNEGVIEAWKADLDHQTRHLEGWANYQQCYREIPAGTYHTDEDHVAGVKQLGRYRRLIQWAKALPQTGEPIEVCAIGAQDCIIERGLIEANPRIRLTVCDVAPQAAVGIQKLIADYPERVKAHAIVDNEYDWPRTSSFSKAPFDAVTLFEVIEHLPSMSAAFDQISSMLKPNGRFFLSTPVSDQWVESYLTDAKRRPSFYWHVRSNNPTTLQMAALDAGFSGKLYATDNGSIFFAEWERREVNYGGEYVAIVAEGAPPFDMESLDRGHLGGSEEAIVHLSRELAKQKSLVFVYLPAFPARPDGDILYAEDTVIFKPLIKFHPHAYIDGDAVLYWRCPHYGRRDDVKTAKHTKLLWLHDTHYGEKPESYAAFDHVLTLSAAHDGTLQKYDGVKRELTRFANGIDPAGFPELDEAQRDSHTAIYASSPERGLPYLLDVWPIVREMVPDAKLKIFYDWTAFAQRFPNEHANLKARVNAMQLMGVEYIGGVSHDRLHEEFRKAGVWAYPVLNFVETFCISAVKTCASGCWPVTVNVGAVPEVLSAISTASKDGFFAGDVLDRWDDKNDVDAELFAIKIAKRMTTEQPTSETRKKLRENAIKAFAWKNAADRLFDILNNRT